MGKLIELDAMKQLANNKYHYFYGDEERTNFLFAINSLPQIDIVGEIEKMIEEYENEQKRISKGSSLHYDLSMYIKTLQELLQKFKS